MQARSQVSVFGGAQYILRGARFLLLLYVQKKISGHNKIWAGTKEIWGELPLNALRRHGPV